MRYRVAELEGAILDAAVAKAAGLSCKLRDEGELVCYAIIPHDPPLLTTFPQQPAPYYPSQMWSHGGPIIERERISLGRVSIDHTLWTAAVETTVNPIKDAPPFSGVCVQQSGPAPLVAAMRAYVASRFGETVELPS